MRNFSRLIGFLAFGVGLVAGVTPASAQSGQTLFLNGELTLRPSSGATEFVMNGHKIAYQADGNLCYKTSANEHRWCVNDHINRDYQNTGIIVYNCGTLTVYSRQGRKLWNTPVAEDCRAAIIVNEQGKLQIRSGDRVYWTNP